MLPLLLALISGAILPLAFAPFSIYPFAFFAPAILFYLWLNASPRQAFFYGLLFGLGCFSVGASWVFISINTYGNTPFLISLLITALFILVLSLFPAIQGYFIAKFYYQKSDVKRCLLIYPAVWALWEIFRTVALTGFPWLLLGYSQITTPLRGYAPLFGIYGISLLAALIAGCLTLLARRNSNGIKSLCVIIIAIIIGVGWFTSDKHWTKISGDSIKTSLIQGNIPQSVKWQSNELANILKIYQNETEKNWQSQLIIWPEAAIPTFPQQVNDFVNDINETAKSHHTYIIYGAPLFDAKTNQYFNGLILTGASHGQYLKRHLVPFGEYFPLKKWYSWFINYFNIPMSDFTAGRQKQPPLQIKNFQIAPFICYEIAYPFEVLNSMNHKQMIVLITDDSWFGHSIALSQQFEIAQMRALETGRYLLLAANTGITGFIDPLGKIISTAPIDQRATLTADVTPMNGRTPLMRWNYYPVIIAIIAMILLGLM